MAKDLWGWACRHFTHTPFAVLSPCAILSKHVAVLVNTVQGRQHAGCILTNKTECIQCASIKNKLKPMVACRKYSHLIQSWRIIMLMYRLQCQWSTLSFILLAVGLCYAIAFSHDWLNNSNHTHSIGLILSSLIGWQGLRTSYTWLPRLGLCLGANHRWMASMGEVGSTYKSFFKL